MAAIRCCALHFNFLAASFFWKPIIFKTNNHRIFKIISPSSLFFKTRLQKLRFQAATMMRATFEAIAFWLQFACLKSAFFKIATKWKIQFLWCPTVSIAAVVECFQAPKLRQMPQAARRRSCIFPHSWGALGVTLNRQIISLKSKTNHGGYTVLYAAFNFF